MNHDPHRELLEDLYTAPNGGPDCATVLGMVRAQRTARRRRRAAGGLALLITVGVSIFSMRDSSLPVPHSLAVQAPQVRHINDDELLDMFDGQPAAIATLPDGSKRLFLLVNVVR